MRLAWFAVAVVLAGALAALFLGIGGPPGVASGPAVTAPPPAAPAPGSEPLSPAPAAPAPEAATESTAQAPAKTSPAVPGADPRVTWRRSQALGLPNAGALRRGVQLPAAGRDFFTRDPVTRRQPNRGWRRWGTDRLVRTVLTTLRGYRRANPDSPRIGIGDLSRPRGGEFGARFGGLGHASHQNGLDVDLYYPRKDRRELRPERPGLVDRRLAQALVDAFVDAGARFVFVGPSLGLQGPSAVVQPLAHHDDHLHVRIR